MSTIDKAWKSDNYKFVGKAFDIAFDNDLEMNLKAIIGEITTDSATYELRGYGGYGRMQRYTGGTLTMGSRKRGFKTILTPDEFSLSDQIGYHEALTDKSGECKRVGKWLGRSARSSVYLDQLNALRRAFDPAWLGGDGKPWAAADHPVASKEEVGRKWVADPDAGTYSNLITDELSVSAIMKAKTMGRLFVTPDGLPYVANYNMVLVAPQLEEKARKLFGPNAKIRPTADPESDYNAANAVYDMNWMVIGGGTDGFQGKQWALCDSEIMKEQFLTVYNTKPTVIQNQLDNPLIDQYTGYGSWDIGWGDARQIIFSNP